MKRRILQIMVIILLVLPLCGCEVMEDGVRVDPNATIKAEGVAEASVGILNALAVLWPAAAVGAAGLATALTAWRNAKTNLTTKQTEADMYYNATRELVLAIEEYKKNNKDKWARLEKEIEKQIGPGVENIIRAIRGWPRKE